MRNFTKRKGCLLAACVLSALANNVFAAETDNTAEKYKMEEYVVTATRTELTEKENPRSVEVITKEDLKSLGAINLRDALRMATNLEIQGGAGSSGDVITIRGGDDVLVLLNGKRHASEGQFSFLNQNAYTLDRININNVERIEILRGPDAAIYGSGAQAGIINIITKKAEQETFTVGAATGSREMSNYYHWDSGKQGKVSAVFDANFSKVRDLSEKAGKSLLYGSKQNYSIDVDYAIDDNNNLNLYLDYSKDNLNYYFGGYSGIPGTVQAGVKAINSEKKTAVLNYDGKDGVNEYSVSASYSNMKRNGTVSDSPDTNDERNYDSWNLEARNAVKLADNNKLVVGAEYRKDKANVFGGAEKAADSYGVYIHDEYSVNDKLLLTPSVRYDYHDSFGGKTSPSFGATYFIADDSRIKASFGSGYRAPSLDELYGIFDHGGMFNFAPMSSYIIYGNPDLKPEKTTGFEISYEKEFGTDTTSKITYFKNKKKDAIVSESTGNGYQTWVNIDSASYEGTEFEVSYDLGNGFKLSGSYAYLDAKDDTTGQRLEYSARNTYTAKLSWVEPEAKEWSATLWNKWYSDYVYGSHNNSLKDGSISTLNFVVNKTWDNNKYNAFVGVDNVFNKDFEDMGYYGRMWRCGFEMNF